MVKLILIIVIAVIILGYFGFSVEGIISSPQVQSNLVYIKKIGLTIFHFLVEEGKQAFTVVATFISELITKAQA